MHIESGKSYIGSSIKLNMRFKQYFNYNHISYPKRNMVIYKALLKYGYAGFRLEILEYCALEVLLSREQFYFDKFSPEYNILKIAGSSQGFKHSPETVAKLKILHSGKLHPRFNTKPSEQQKLLTSLALKKYYEKHDHHGKGKKGNLSPQFGKGGTKITMIDEQGTIIAFPSINSARLHFKVRFSTISKNINKSIHIHGVKWSITTSNS